MIACSFDEANGDLGPPPGLTEDQVHSLRVFKGHDQNGFFHVVSCWRVTPEEIEKIKETGRVWMISLGGMAPVRLTADKPEMEQLPPRASKG